MKWLTPRIISYEIVKVEHLKDVKLLIIKYMKPND